MRIWDMPVRVIHWLIVALVIVAWATRDARYLDLHAAAGYCILGLCAFRIAWGFAGTRHARFRDFLHAPRAAFAYLAALAARRAPAYTGHNPAGGWSIIALLALEVVIVASGIVAIAGMHALGPLASAIDHASADAALGAHEVAAWIMVAVVVLHLAGVAASSLAHRENLVAAMITGRKRVEESAAPVAQHRLAAAGLVLACVAFFTGYLWLSAADAREMATAASKLEPSVPATWRAECESCHLPYAPCMLPPQSWEATWRGQADHFGEDLGLGAEVLAELARAAAHPVANESWACWKTRTSVAPGAAPLRIAQTPYWLRAHARMPATAFRAPLSAGPHDCAACHGDAASSIFHPRMIRISQ